MTDDDKALVERLRGDWPEILVEKHWMMDSDAIDMQREEAADRIEAQAAEIEKLRRDHASAVNEANIAKARLKGVQKQWVADRTKIVAWLRSDKIVLSMDGSKEDIAASAIEAGEHLK